MTSASGSGKGSGRKIAASTTENIAVFAPIPSASTSTAAIVNPGERRSRRRAYRKSCMAGWTPALPDG
jgi:hypothetical protein